ncbi:hypothetical protein [Aureimonas frigidaquae]|uniref:Uncharacterized protein n=1 Tax=Aureimonas frigidaquae TaxID=424757 RepID=A0A0P0Z4L7_9HYPH|nr:hypothetical protein [Aureimonas frigidaquae]BAT28776.1 hypothetical protein [Aureimonas frigidaquae]
MREGLYVATYGLAHRLDGRGYAVACGGRLYCINPMQGFAGSYVVLGQRIMGTVRLIHQLDAVPRKGNIVVNFDGRIEGPTVIIDGSAKDPGALPFHAIMTWISA